MKVGDGYSEKFDVVVGVHQGSVLSLFLLFIVLEAISMEFRTGSFWKLLYADDLVIILDNIEDLVEKLNTWMEVLKKKRLRQCIMKTKVIISGCYLELVKKCGKYPCGVFFSGVGSNSIFSIVVVVGFIKNVLR